MGKGLEVLQKFTNVYKKLGPSGYTVVIHLAPEILYAQQPDQTPTSINVTEWVIEAQAQDIAELKKNNLIAVEYDIILDMWGGALEPEKSLLQRGQIAVVEPMLERAKQHAAGISYGPRKLKIVDYYKDLVVEGILPRVFLVCQGTGSVK